MGFNKEAWNRGIKYGKVQTHYESDIRTGTTCIYLGLNSTGGHMPGIILYITILLKIYDKNESLHLIENSRTSASETRDCKLCALRHILP